MLVETVFSQLIYSLRSASIGDSIEALIAGYSPNEIPIAAENNIEIKNPLHRDNRGPFWNDFSDFYCKK